MFLFTLLRALRPRQWLKNFALFAPIVLTGQLFNPFLFTLTCKAFIAFCLLSSANYLFNDVLDRAKDRKHPFKRFRPIASGKISIPLALLCSGTLVIAGIMLSLTVNTSFFFMSLLFILLAFTYTLFLKHMAVVDILTIALAYFLRVYAGEAATGYHLSIWISLAVFSLSLFLAIGKRRAELTLIQNYAGTNPKDTRATLGHYSERLLDTYTAMFANSTWITYAFYTFLEKPPQSKWAYRVFLDDLFPADRKWLMATIPIVLYGIMRYMQLIYEGKGESPEQILTSDIPLISTIVVWDIFVIGVIYGIGG
ncbi:TPA: decaprenyl-phosphate phosphoribosyltransferase [Patescibacteria group bacterium]|uniref:Prenyltransferase UbiA n=1 Tax=Candidatus Gottesmanbacteria bacterium GW2011_GWA1_43_11 TaxID=1618436 RepID=A0A0G1FH52_9BACT|nr:MAG: Prenyltransferase UbiA [Candidatus Gottesmanbacteria bacterium GW2011_GWA1_43_11]HCS78792.1 decaprenyl-phosphate phosphoribosyltransferase [Patescibacteria group bacterium]